MNLSGLEFVSGHQTPLPAAIAYYKSASMNAFRLPIAWELVQPTLGGPLDPTIVAAIHATIVHAAPETIILDLHNFGRRDGKAIGTAGAATMTHFTNLWYRLASAFPGCVYNLMNEPHDEYDSLVVDLMNAGIAGARSVSKNALILISLNNWSNRAAFGKASNNYWLYGYVHDPNPKATAIDYHCYLDPWSAGQSAVIDAGWPGDVQLFTTWCAQKGVRAFMGEFGVAADAGSIAAADQLLDYVEAHTNVWLGWTWWGGGGWWPYSYLFRLDPYGSRWDAANPYRVQAASWPAPLPDRPQMTMLRTHLRA